MVTGEEAKAKLPSHILSILNKVSDLTIKHTPFVIAAGIENMRGATVIDTGAGVCCVSNTMVERITNLYPKRLTLYAVDAELRGAN